MYNFRILNSYNIWLPSEMKSRLLIAFDGRDPDFLNRSWTSIYVEWWLHNFGYYLTLPFCKFPYIAALNERFKHLDVNSH